MVYLTAYFTSGGTPAEGLSPTISVWKTDGTPVVSDSAMSEIAGGFYTFDFSTYSNQNDYVMRAYESTLPTAEQYVVATNEADSLTTQGVYKQILGLVQSNFTMTGQTYDSCGNLTYAEIYTYENSTDCENDTNRLHEYEINAVYTNGRLTSYQVQDL